VFHGEHGIHTWEFVYDFEPWAAVVSSISLLVSQLVTSVLRRLQSNVHCSYAATDGSARACGRKSVSIDQAVAEFPLDPGSGNVDFVMGSLVQGQICFEYFNFPCQSLHLLLQRHQPSSGAGTVSQIATDVPS
jgi:hypothetical protein